MLLLNISWTLNHQSQKQMESLESYFMVQAQPLPDVFTAILT